MRKLMYHLRQREGGRERGRKREREESREVGGKESVGDGGRKGQRKKEIIGG